LEVFVISYRDVHGIAEELGVDVQTVRRWIQSGKLRAFKPGKEYRIKEADLEEFLAAREVRPKAPGRSSREPSFNDVLDERRLSRFAGAIALAAERWSEALVSTDMGDDKRFGLIDAALSLSDVISERAEAEDWEALTYQEQLDIVTTMEKLVEAANLGLGRVRESQDRQEQDQRAKESREQIREWTRRISRKSA
jgi:excisionase family DNA binding protein